MSGSDRGTRALVDLETAYPGYRIFMSEDHEPGCARDPWNFELRNVGGRGKVWPYGGDVLVAYANRRFLVERLIAIPGVTVQQRGEGEVMVQFRPGTETEKAVFAVIKPARKAKGGSREALERIRPLGRSHPTAPEPIGAENPADRPSGTVCVSPRPENARTGHRGE